MSKGRKTALCIIGLLIIIVSGLLIYIYLNKDLPKSAESNGEKEKNNNNKDKEKYNIQYKIENDDDSQYLIVNENKVDFGNLGPITINNITSVKDVLIVDVLATDFSTLYAVSSEGEVLWYIRSEVTCKELNDTKCISVIGDSISKTFNYIDKYYKIDEQKITFTKSLTSQDDEYSSCNANEDDIYSVEYEIDYLGNNRFSDIKEINKMSAKEYIEKNSIICSEMNV